VHTCTLLTMTIRLHAGVISGNAEARRSGIMLTGGPGEVVQQAMMGLADVKPWHAYLVDPS
jgi:hypothetical protein